MAVDVRNAYYKNITHHITATASGPLTSIAGRFLATCVEAYRIPRILGRKTFVEKLEYLKRQSYLGRKTFQKAFFSAQPTKLLSQFKTPF